jgi:hypothetical protein
VKKVGIIAALSALLVALSAAVALAVAPGTYDNATINPANANNGAHFAGKTSAPTCTVAANLDISCTGYQLAGVGNNLDAAVELNATYTATVVCINGGGNPSDSQHQGSFPTSTGAVPLHADKNGRLSVPSISVTAPTEQQFLAQQTCPNPNWDPTIPGGISLQSFSYTLTFQGFSGPYITVAQP